MWWLTFQLHIMTVDSFLQSSVYISNNLNETNVPGLSTYCPVRIHNSSLNVTFIHSPSDHVYFCIMSQWHNADDGDFSQFLQRFCTLVYSPPSTHLLWMFCANALTCSSVLCTLYNLPVCLYLLQLWYTADWEQPRSFSKLLNYLPELLIQSFQHFNTQLCC